MRVFKFVAFVHFYSLFGYVIDKCASFNEKKPKFVVSFFFFSRLFAIFMFSFGFRWFSIYYFFLLLRAAICFCICSLSWHSYCFTNIIVVIMFELVIFIGPEKTNAKEEKRKKRNLSSVMWFLYTAPTIRGGGGVRSNHTHIHAHTQMERKINWDRCFYVFVCIFIAMFITPKSLVICIDIYPIKVSERKNIRTSLIFFPVVCSTLFGGGV